MNLEQFILNKYFLKCTARQIVDNGNGLKINVFDSGYNIDSEGTILFLHGFPELAFSWRYITAPIVEAGYRVIVPDQRGYGLTTGGENSYNCDLSSFSVLNLTNDMLGLLKSLGIDSVKSVIGHDFGAYVAAYLALIHPTKFRSTVIMSAPFSGPPTTSFSDKKTDFDKLEIYKALENLNPPRKHYQRYYSSNGADKNMRNCPQGIHNFLRAYFHFKSADHSQNQPFPLNAWSADELSKLPRYYIMNLEDGMAETVAKEMPTTREARSCKWLSDWDLSLYSDIYKITGFQGGLNWYRARFNKTCSQELETFSGHQIEVPSCFVSGKQDWGTYQVPGSYEKMNGQSCTNFKGYHLIENAGHWVQQEQPIKVKEILLKFLESL